MTAFEVWGAVCLRFAEASGLRKNSLKVVFQSTERNRGERLADFRRRLTLLAQEMRDVGLQVTEEDLKKKLIVRCLPQYGFAADLVTQRAVEERRTVAVCVRAG